MQHGRDRDRRRTLPRHRLIQCGVRGTPPDVHAERGHNTKPSLPMTCCVLVSRHRAVLLDVWRRSWFAHSDASCMHGLAAHASMSSVQLLARPAGGHKPCNTMRPSPLLHQTSLTGDTKRSMPFLAIRAARSAVASHRIFAGIRYPAIDGHAGSTRGERRMWATHF